MARTTRTSRGQLRGLAKQLWQEQLSPVIASGVREAGLQIVNELAQAGPAWSGKFSASWDIVPEGGTGRQRESTGSIYRYTRRNFPLRRFENALNSRQGSNTVRFSIVNTAPHASIALDQEEGYFYRPSLDPIKINTIELGEERVQPSMRYEIGPRFIGDLEDAPASRTAEPDWFQDYVSSALQRALGVGVSRGFSFPQIS